ncbi:MAG: sigma-70 family RNA polymerase sigma factor [Oscillibacter sp.]|nr:sigma-70 family RNA polymerase sigma factor [Oscillibacter sp.]
MGTEKQTNEELAAAIRAGQKELLPQLWNQVERFVVRQASRVMTLSGGFGGGAEFEDLYQSGYLALVAAVEGYDPERGMSFIGYLAFTLKTAFAEVGGIRNARQANDALRHAGSLDAPVGDDDGDATLADMIPAAAPEPEDLAVESLYIRQLHDALEAAMRDLSHPQRDILRRRYYGGQTQATIAAALGCTGAGVSEQERAALDRLYRARTVNGLSEFLETHTNYYQAVGPGTFQRTGTSAVEKIVLKREQLAQKWLRAHEMTKGGGNCDETDRQ